MYIEVKVKLLKENLIKTLVLAISFISGFKYSFSQFDSVYVKADSTYSTVYYKAFYFHKDSNKKKVDSIVIKNYFQNVFDCYSINEGRSFVIIYSTNGTNSVTKGKTLHIIRFIYEKGGLREETRCNMSYGASPSLRKFGYNILKDQIVFFSQENPEVKFILNTQEFSDFSTLAKTIFDKCESLQ